MRCEAIEGYYLQYKDSGKPVEVLDRVTYSFQSDDRTCLVKHANHLAILLKTDRYRVVGVELADVGQSDVVLDGTGLSPLKPVEAKPKRGRPRKGR
jgi:hypothetical protein